jgi:NADPH-dependent 2,4-dienoyl-CoA reductase/sulfur reductase-like enzyme
MNYKQITVAGSGVLGSQIAYQTAYKGFHVNVYDVSEEVLAHARERLTKLKENYKEDLGATQQAVDEALNRVTFYTDLAQSVADADLLIEAIPEVPNIKAVSIKNSGKWRRRRRSSRQTHLPCCPVSLPKQLAAPISFWHFIFPTVSGKTILPKL